MPAAARYGCEWLITFGRTMSQNTSRCTSIPWTNTYPLRSGRHWSRSTVAFVSVIDSCSFRVCRTKEDHEHHLVTHIKRCFESHFVPRWVHVECFQNKAKPNGWLMDTRGRWMTGVCANNFPSRVIEWRVFYFVKNDDNANFGFDSFCSSSLCSKDALQCKYVMVWCGWRTIAYM